jgi:hypothetical protein
VQELWTDFVANLAIVIGLTLFGVITIGVPVLLAVLAYDIAQWVQRTGRKLARMVRLAFREPRT